MSARLAVCLGLAVVVCAAGVALPAEQQKRPDSPPIHARIRDTMRELWRSHIQAPAEKESTGQLDRAIRELESIRPGRPRPVGPGPDDIFKPDPKGSTTKPTSRRAQIPPKLLAEIKDLLKTGVADPAGLAEALRLDGHPDLAADFYDMAMGRTSDAKEKAWLLFQSANCLRQKNPSAASKKFQELLAEYPDSPWAPLAQAQAQVVEWRQTNNVTALFEQIEKETPK